jgi:hypothetical protein
MNGNDTVQALLARTQKTAIAVGIAGAAACFVGAFARPEQFLHSYLLGYLFWLELAVGGFAILMLHTLIGGRWGYVIRRPLEAAAGTLPLMALLFVPLAIGHGVLYKQPFAAHSFDAAYLSTSFFFLRAVFYFLVWILFAFLLISWSKKQDAAGGWSDLKRMQALSGPGLILYGLTITFASVDWVMALEHGFFSTIYGMLFIVMPALATMAFVVMTMTVLSRHKPVADVVKPNHFHDQGNLLLTFVMLWAYLSFSQFLIIWAGNLVDEIPWYVKRAEGGWAPVALGLVLFHFALPFLLLLHRPIKQDNRRLSMVAGLLFIMSWVDLYWIIMPIFSPNGPDPSWMDLAATFAVGGFWLALFVRNLKSKPFFPQRDPRFAGVVVHE